MEKERTPFHDAFFGLIKAIPLSWLDYRVRVEDIHLYPITKRFEGVTRFYTNVWRPRGWGIKDDIYLVVSVCRSAFEPVFRWRTADVEGFDPDYDHSARALFDDVRKAVVGELEKIPAGIREELYLLRPVEGN